MFTQAPQFSTMRGFTRTLAGVAALLVTAPLLATPLTGSGTHLPIPSPNPPLTAETRVISNLVPGVSFDGTWSAPALSPWHGTFSATGPLPAGAGPTGTTNYDFSTLNAGKLPSGTYFRFGDLDGGSQTGETFRLRAFDVLGNQITSAWLDEPINVSGVGRGPGSTVTSDDMPGWSFSGGVYDFVGSTTPGFNPSAGVTLPSNVDVYTLEVFRSSDFANFSLAAPVPEPASVLLLMLGAVSGVLRRR